MAAHRRHALRGEAPHPGRRAIPPRGRRRARTSRAFPLLPVAFGVALLGVGVLAGPRVLDRPADPPPGRLTPAALPRDVPDRGLVYADLRPAPRDTLCAGSFELLGPETCTHGPDTAPPGLSVRRDVRPVAPAWPAPAAPRRETTVPGDATVVRDEAGRVPAGTDATGAPALAADAGSGDDDFVMGRSGVACAGDGRSGKRIQVVYLYGYGTPSRYTRYLDSIRTWAAGVDAVYDASAAETGGSRHLRYVTTPGCAVDVAEVQVPAGALVSFADTVRALQTLGYNRTDRKYLLFTDANVYCGIGTYVADRRPGAGNRNNGGPSYARVDAGCWSAVMAAHETTHMLGAVLTGAPHATGAGGCTDEHDLLCGRDQSNAPVREVCPSRYEQRLDCNHDDYFDTDPEPGSYLDRNWNVAQSEFLLRGDGGADPPVVVPAPAPSGPPSGVPSAPAPSAPGGAPPGPGVPSGAPPGAPSGIPPGAPSGVAPGAPSGVAPGAPSGVAPGAPSGVPAGTPSGVSPVAAPSAAPTATRPAARRVPAVLEVRDPTSTSVRLNWTAAAPDARYEVLVDGRRIAVTTATRARLIGLRPGTAYQVTVRDATLRYAARAGARTVPAARPVAGSWYLLNNALTGHAAEVYAARAAAGTPVVLGAPDGGAQQQWRLDATGRGTFALVSQATGKCLAPQGGNPAVGVPVVQGDCAAPTARRWTVEQSAYGFGIRTAGGRLVLGAGVQRFGGHRVLVLQQPGAARHQSWTATPG